MTLIDYFEEIEKYSYEQFCEYLIKKYGQISANYYLDNFSPNLNIKRWQSEKLEIHHIREDTIANLSNYEIAKNAPFEYQYGENLVYCSLIEHLFLHILIGEQMNGLGYGGAEIIIAKLNDIIQNDEEQELLNVLKDRLKNGITAYETVLEHNMTLFLDLDNTLSKSDRALVVLGTGLGKTTTALAYIRKYNLKALVLGPNRLITDAWAKNTEVDAYTYQWFMRNYKNIDYSQYGILVCDEAHHCTAERWGEGIRYVLDNNIIKVIGLTATPREDSKDKAKYKSTSTFFNNQLCTGFTVLDGIEREIIHDFSYVGAIYDTTGLKEKYTNISDTTLLGELDLAINNTPTVKTILTKHMPTNKRKGIIFVSSIEAMEEAEIIMKDIFPNVEYRRLHSLMPGAEVEENRDWFQNTDEGYLLAVNMISEGAHYRGVNTIIMFRRTQSSLVFNQQLGRIITLARDEDPHAIVFDLVNNAENLDIEKSFCASLRGSYAARKVRGGRTKSEQIIVEDYAEKISEVLEKLREIGQKRAVICIETQKVYDGVNEAGRATGIQPMSISGACRGLRITAGKYHWAYTDDIDTITKLACYIGCGPAKKIAPGKYKPVMCIETGVIYESCQDADVSAGVSRGKVSAVCCGTQETAGGYHWCFIDDKTNYNKYKDFVGKSKKTGSGIRRKVRCIETNEVFDSIAEAKRAKKCNNIDKVLSGERKIAGGYHWECVD